MSYFADEERLVFLHFLNREAFEAARSSRNCKEDLIALNALTICHCSKMTVNISQMIEYTYDKPEIVGPLSQLVSAGILITTSHDKDHDEFISNRQRLYSAVADRYPMYFLDTKMLEEFSIRQKNTFSMSRLLRRDIHDISAGELGLFRGHAQPEDWQLFKQHIDAVQVLFGSNPEAAVTRANIDF